MADQVHVTEQNLAQFQQWLLTLRAPDFNPNLYFDLPLDVILNGAPNPIPSDSNSRINYPNQKVKTIYCH